MKKRDLDELRNCIEGLSVIVCGCGPSLTDSVPVVEASPAYTIGVNDACERVECDYLLMVDAPSRIHKLGRWEAIQNYTGPVVTAQAGDIMKATAEGKTTKFTPLKWSAWYPFWYTPRVQTSKGNLQIQKQFNCSNNSPFIACMLALWMGATRIGLIGVDVTEDHETFRNWEVMKRDYATLRKWMEGQGKQLEVLTSESRLWHEGVLPLMSIENFG